MLTLLNIYKDKAIWFVTVCIAVLFAVVPYSVVKYNIPLLIVMVGLACFMIFRQIRGVVALIFAYSLMIPSTSSTIGLGATRYIPYIFVTLSLILLDFFTSRKTFYKFSFSAKMVIPILVVGVLFSFVNSTIFETLMVVFFVISTYGVFRLALLDRVTLRQFYLLLDIVFYFTLFYTIQEFYWGSSPYQIIYDDKSIGLQARAKGLLGHPLILSFFLSFYVVSMITQGMLLKKWKYFNFLLAIPFLFICASRTSFILIGVAFIVYVLVEKKYKNPRFIFFTALVVGAASILLIRNSDMLDNDLAARLLSSAADQRIGAFSVAQNIFADHTLGIGLSLDALKSELSRGNFHASSKYDPVFLTIDNAYLSLLIGYGILCILFYPIYASPLMYSWKFRKNRKVRKHVYAILLIFVIWLLQNFSFDTFYYFPINSFYFILAALIIRHMRMKARHTPIVVSQDEPFSLPITT